MAIYIFCLLAIWSFGQSFKLQIQSVLPAQHSLCSYWALLKNNLSQPCTSTLSSFSPALECFAVF